ncbi:hypothetical protein, partial [Streptomyces sp. NPDC056045]|uniref:hypothetical protein n=1 Tax=Streptomyces sp. NPDC056045 TaxID=3345691 RepID=UPI0035D9910C
YQILSDPIPGQRDSPSRSSASAFSLSGGSDSTRTFSRSVSGPDSEFSVTVEVVFCLSADSDSTSSFSSP